jgi:glycerophosphoryl diester phosphodiesterase
MRRAFRWTLAGAAALAAGLWILNSSRLADPPATRPTLLAHRGIAQRFDERDLRNDTCTASRMLPPTHGYLENTLPSIRASFEAGADLVEIDVHPTTDGQFAVFHDWTLECRTEGRGETRAHTMAQLKQLDVGHGYTADGGRTYPFRGKGIGLMPSLAEVLRTFPDRRFVINVKSRDPTEGRQLAAALAQLPPAQRAGLIVYGGDEPVAEVRRRLPDVRTASRASLKSCLLGYLALGWSGYVPEPCTRSMVLVPVNFTPVVWGWPHRMQRRMEQAGSEVFVLGPFSGGFTTGIDTPEELARLPAGYAAGIWTNEIEPVARALARADAGAPERRSP